MIAAFGVVKPAPTGRRSFFSYVCFMVIIRRKVTRSQAFTEIILSPEDRREFPTTDYEHKRILQIYLQDKRYPGIQNDHTEENPYFYLNPEGKS